MYQVWETVNTKIRHGEKMAIDVKTATQFIDDAIDLLSGISKPATAATDAIKKLHDVSLNSMLVIST